MIGAIVGDIVGSIYEWDNIKTKDFDFFDEHAFFTDDTVMTLAVAMALKECQGNYENLSQTAIKWMQKLGRKYPDAGYGGNFRAWLNEENPQPYNSWGNGSAMRVSPVAYCYKDEYQMLKAAEATAACSHNHPEGIKGAKTVAMAIYTARELHQGRNVLGEKDIDYILSRCTAISNYDIEIEMADVINRFDETCQGTVPVALWIIGESTSFEDAVRKAVSLGADADTLGSIVGSIAEAIWGISIDMQIQAMNYLPSDMKRVVLRFYRRYIDGGFLAGYGDEGAAIDLLTKDEK
jgi:ADP-ribosylglycohydrolase